MLSGQPPRVAVCYWGLTRSTRYTAPSHEKHLRAVFASLGIHYDVFIHTWYTKEPFVWGNKDRPIDRTEGMLLNPDYFHMDNQDDYIRALDLSTYFNADLYKLYGGDSQHEWRPELIRNHLCALESQRRVYQMAVDTAAMTGRRYDFVVFIRPDMELLSDFPAAVFGQLGPRRIAICNHSHNEGYNDRFAILRFEDAAPYAKRNRELIAYRRERGRITSEKVVKYIVDKYYEAPIEIVFGMRRVRSDGSKAAS